MGAADCGSGRSRQDSVALWAVVGRSFSVGQAPASGALLGYRGTWAWAYGRLLMRRPRVRCGRCLGLVGSWGGIGGADERIASRESTAKGHVSYRRRDQRGCGD